MIHFLNINSGAVTALATIALLCVTALYAWVTYLLLKETRQSRLLASQPRVVAYLRVNEVHSNIAQLCIANLSGAAAVCVRATFEQVTTWPTEFYLRDSKILRDLSFMRAHEVLKFDLGMGPELFKDGAAASFRVKIDYASLDGRNFAFDNQLNVESVEGHSHFQIYGLDDIARHLDKIVGILKGYTGFSPMRVNVYDSNDRANEAQIRDEQIKRARQREASSNRNAK